MIIKKNLLRDRREEEIKNYNINIYKTDKLPLLFNDYELPGIKETGIDNLKDKDEISRILRSKKKKKKES